MRALIIISLTALLGGCGGDDQPAGSTNTSSAAAPVARRTGPADSARIAHAPGRAPVDITATIADRSSASVRVQFRAAAEDVTINIYGTDGLRVTGGADGALETDRRAGEDLTLEVAFDTGGASHSGLVVLVEGTFRGRSAKRIVSFTVGDPLPARSGSALRATAPGAERLKVMPAIEKR